MTDLSEIIKTSVTIINDADAYRIYMYSFLLSPIGNNPNERKVYIHIPSTTALMGMTQEEFSEAVSRLQCQGLANATYIAEEKGLLLSIPTGEVKSDESKPRSFSLRRQLLADGADPVYVDAYMEVRKKKRAANTIVAYNLLKNEAKLAGLDIPKVVRICAEHNWQGFRHTWEFERPEEPVKETSAYQ